jgi:hypothetical protein
MRIFCLASRRLVGCNDAPRAGEWLGEPGFLVSCDLASSESFSFLVLWRIKSPRYS